jgi:hypothetical protein
MGAKGKLFGNVSLAAVKYATPDIFHINHSSNDRKFRFQARFFVHTR